MDCNQIVLANWRNVLLAIGIGGSYLVWGLIYSVQAPFYADEALSRGANLSQSGFVFGIVHLSGFISASLMSIFGERFSVRKMSFLGAFLQGLAVFGFGMLEFVENVDLFLSLSYLLRSLEGFFSALAMAAYSATFINLYPHSIGAITSWSGSVLGIGYSIGPIIGGFFYDIGGFHLPFSVIGILAMLLSIVTVVALPHIEFQKRESAEKYSFRIIPKMFLNNKRIFIPYLDCLVCSMGISLLESEYSQYLHSVGAKESVIQTTFGLIGIFNFVGKVISGNFLDGAKEAPLIFSLIGNICMLLAYASLGTLPYWPLSHEQKQWIMMATSPLLSSGFVFIYISTFSRIYHLKLSLSISMDTSSIKSGLWTSANYLGMFLGPSIGGILADNLGLQAAALIFSVLICLTATTDFIELKYLKLCAKQEIDMKEEESEAEKIHLLGEEVGE